MKPDYRILDEPSLSMLQAQVQLLMQQRYLPTGGVCFDGNRYIQALYRA